MSQRKNLITVVVIVVIIILIGLVVTKKPTTEVDTVASTPPPVNQNESPRIVSTKPDPLEDTIVSATEIVEITFNRPLENVGEFKSRIEPKIDYKVELSGDRKTAKIIPEKPYELGTTYTLFIGTETKFDGVGRWGEEKIYHFKTIRYRGI